MTGAVEESGSKKRGSVEGVCSSGQVLNQSMSTMVCHGEEGRKRSGQMWVLVCGWWSMSGWCPASILVMVFHTKGFH